MHLKILGTGSTQVSEDRASTSNYLEIGGKKVLVDCGTGALIRLSQAGIPFKDIDVVFISHFHMDHISDLYPLLHGLAYPRLNRKKDLLLVGPEGFPNFYERHIEPLVLPEDFDLFEIETSEMKDEMKFDDFRVEAQSTPHTEESLAYKFTEDGKELVIAGDTDYDEGLIDFSRDADLLILECSYGNDRKVEGHLVPEKCGKIAKQAGVKRLILTHFYPVSKDSRLKDTKKIFENTEMAEDLMEIDI